MWFKFVGNPQGNIEGSHTSWIMPYIYQCHVMDWYIYQFVALYVANP
jgi:hypothetical protein